MTVGPSVRRSVRPGMFVKKWTLEYQTVIKTYFLTYLCESSDSSDSIERSDSSDRSDSCDSSDSSDSCDSSDKLKLWWN